MTDAATIPSFRDPEVLACPYPAFDAIRAESPVYRKPELGGIAMVTRFEDAVRVLRDPETFSNDAYDKIRGGGIAQRETVKEILATGFPPAKALAQTDGDRHLYHASLLKPFLTPAKIREMEPRVKASVDRLLDGAEEGQVFDWVTDFAEPLAISVMCDFVGITPEFRDVVVRGAEAEARLMGSFASDEVLIEAAHDWVALQKYAAREIEDRRANPRDDLISSVANTPPPPGVEPLTMPEAVHIVKVAFVAGNETTRSALSAAALRLIQNPGLMDRLRAEPTALRLFIEETLRVDAPVLMLFRIATKDTEVGGEKIAKGETLAVVYGAANRDAAEFACPAEIDIDRENARRHLTFGLGTHFCLGAPIARLELQLGLQGLLDRFQSLEQVPDTELEYSPSFTVRSLSHLQVFLHKESVPA